ncbi:MAG: hypothetical protein GYB65_19295 [Chloroflexi bacterium]|nr:hypothetical protein [Chloroflexota bacterium]
MVSSIAGPVGAQDTTQDNASWQVSVWYPSSDHPGGYDSILANLDVIDEVNPFWYTPRPDGTLSVSQDFDPDKLAEWRAADLTIVPTIVSFEQSVMIETPELHTAHIAAIVDLVETMDYDGIEIDYEGFDLDTRDAFSTFIEDLATALHAQDRVLAIAVHAKTADQGPGVWSAAAAQDWLRLAAAVDTFKIMTYDYSAGWSEAGPIGPPAWVLDVLAYATTVTDLEKVRLGLHFYGYSWQRGQKRPITWEAVTRWIDSFDLEIVRDPADMELSVTVVAQGLPRQDVYVADAVGLSYKLEQVLADYPELDGVCIWGLGGEDPANWDVLRAYE